MAIHAAKHVVFDVEAPVVIVGAGACGLVAALAAHDAGQAVTILERDDDPRGSTSLSGGLIPAPRSRLQIQAGIDDSPDLLVDDIMAKTGGRTSRSQALVAARTIGPVIDWLMDAHGLEFELVQGFLYPGHSRLRMHGSRRRSGADLQQALLAAVANAGIDVVTGASVDDLYADPTGHILGVACHRRDGTVERLGCKALVLACSGFAGDPRMVRDHIPEIADAERYGHLSNTGDAVKWGVELGAAIADMGAYQGHGSLAHPHSLPLTWAVITKGGILLNTDGRRFSNEMRGYSEHGCEVAAQPGHVAWDVFGVTGDEAASGFHDYRELRRMGAVRTTETLEELASATSLSLEAVRQELDAIAAAAERGEPDRFGRRFKPDEVLRPPYFAVRVKGALFHTQGGLVIDEAARVLREDGTPLPNLTAGGGAARGLSGNSSDGYLSGNGLLSALAFGSLAGRSAARLAAGA